MCMCVGTKNTSNAHIFIFICFYLVIYLIFIFKKISKIKRSLTICMCVCDWVSHDGFDHFYHSSFHQLFFYPWINLLLLFLLSFILALYYVYKLCLYLSDSHRCYGSKPAVSYRYYHVVFVCVCMFHVCRCCDARHFAPTQYISYISITLTA